MSNDSNPPISLKFKSSDPFSTLPRTAPRDKYTIYWDGGAKKIEAWKEQHLRASPSGKERAAEGLCSENWICTALGLSTLEMEDLGDEGDPCSPRTSSTTADSEKGGIGYLLNAY
jgi:hypothetical protein